MKALAIPSATYWRWAALAVLLSPGIAGSLAAPARLGLEFSDEYAWHRVWGTALNETNDWKNQIAFPFDSFISTDSPT